MDLIAGKTRTAVDRLGVQAFELEMGGTPDDKKAACKMPTIKPDVVQVAAVHDIDCTRFGVQQIQRVKIVEPTIADVDKGRDGTA